MRCVYCGRDINEIGQENVSPIPGKPMCEDCNSSDIDIDIPKSDYTCSEEDM